MSNLETGPGRDIEPVGEQAVESSVEAVAEQAPPIDLDLIERDLRDVETTLARLADGTYVANEPVAFVPGTDATGSAPSPVPPAGHGS